MFGDLGFFLLMLATFTNIYGLTAALAAARVRERRVLQSARLAATTSTVLVILASLLLWVMLAYRDYSIAYVWRNSSSDLGKRPCKITALGL